MFVGIGYVIILAAVFGSYVAGGGHLGALLQPLEFLMIFGAAFGAFLATNGGPALKSVIAALPSAFKGPKYNKAVYMELFALLFELLTKVRKEGLMSIEMDVDAPESSPIFSKYPTILADHHIVEFMTDYLRLMVGGNLNAFEIENLMDVEIDTHHHEGEVPVNAVRNLADAMPAFGIVAAVMGVVHTMESVGLPPEELGILIARALVGTFLGILMGYGFIGPIGAILSHRHADQTRILQTIKVTLLASINGYAPQVAVEFGRKALSSADRPGFAELEDHVKQSKNR
ncbi:flagellar motor stator protein MotA [Neisseriaceae bacterium JH1-16]|nr:flagellar motor stator protein MotA [Neisseriaceae bacterium JH1-16]